MSPAWEHKWRRRLDEIGASIQLAGGDVTIRCGEYLLQIMLPGCVIMLVEGMEEHLQDRITDLNDKMDKLEAMDPQSKLHSVVEHLLDTLETFHRKRLRKLDQHLLMEEDDEENEDENEAEDDEDGEEDDFYAYQSDLMSCNKSPGSLFWLAEGASGTCADARERGSPPPGATADFYRHCKVTHPSFSSVFVRMEIQLGGLFPNNDRLVLEPLQLDVQLPVSIALEFDSNTWNASPLQKAAFRGQVSIVHQRTKVLGFGEGILLPTLVDIFMSFYNSGNTSITGRKNVIQLEDLMSNNCYMYEALKRATGMDNPILGLLYFVTSQLGMLPAWCPLCFSLLPSRPNKLLSCQADKCTFEFQEQGLASCALVHIQKNRAVVQLELDFLGAAASSSRDVLEPFPSFLLKAKEYRKQNGWFASTDTSAKKSDINNKMIDLIRTVLKTIPSLEDLSRCVTEEELARELERTLSNALATKLVNPLTVEHPHRLSYKLLSYCLSSNRTSLQLLEGQDKLPLTDNITQFVVLHDTPEKEAVPEALRKKSFFAFHGSGGGNWYSILRNGIRSMSGSSYMSTGSMYGRGIYCSHALSVSLSYSQAYSSVRCLAIVEVFHEVQLQQNFCYVIPKEHEDKVVLRYLLLVGDTQLAAATSTLITGCTLNPDFDLAAHHRRLRLNASNVTSSN